MTVFTGERGFRPKQKAFCEAYAANGGDTEKAALEAGYSASFARKQAYLILKLDHCKEYIASLNKITEARNVATIIEIQTFWTNIVRGKIEDGDYPAKLSDRIRASELLAKSKGMFLEKVQLTDAEGKSVPTITLNFVKPEQMSLFGEESEKE
jgi:hypothetical protein